MIGDPCSFDLGVELGQSAVLAWAWVLRAHVEVLVNDARGVSPENCLSVVFEGRVDVFVQVIFGVVPGGVRGLFFHCWGLPSVLRLWERGKSLIKNYR